MASSLLSAMGMLNFIPIFNRSAGVSRILWVLVTFLLSRVCLAPDNRAIPLIPDTPFLWAWNAPTEICEINFNEPIDLKFFSLLGSPQKDLTGQRVTVFYFDRLGLYPYIDNATDTNVNGGIPQKGFLKSHLDKTKEDISFYMPEDKIGLAIIDWQEWDPLWERNWKPKDIYQQRSIQTVKSEDESLSDTDARDKAKADFEAAAKNYMKETLKTGVSMRPNYIWGYYLYPDCYNNRKGEQIDESCSAEEKGRNDELSWLWEESTALYPSIDLTTELKSTPRATLYARNRIQEAIRVSKMLNAEDPLPVYVNTRLVFTDAPEEYLSQDDLVSTIGESAALGASGIVMWENFDVNQQTCTDLNNYMKTTLNPYLINVTLAAKFCSQMLCQDNGVCARKQVDSNDYLHLSSESFAIQPGEDGKYVVSGKPEKNDLQYLFDNFHCNCYSHISCHEVADIKSIDNINVCLAEDVCVELLVSEELSDTTSLPEEESSGNSENTTESIQCVPGEDYHECLKIKCSMQEMFDNITDPECEGVNWHNVTGDLHFTHSENSNTPAPEISKSIKFSVYILHFDIADIFIYTTLASFSFFFM